MLNQFKRSIANFIAPYVNSMSLPNQFLRYGSRKLTTPDWSQVVMNDKDHYTGYLYAAIKKRANKVARLATEEITTKSETQELVHPYLQIIDQSPTFSNYYFWYKISTYLDLEGWFPLMAVRNFSENRMGNVNEFKLLNPYYVKPVYQSDTFELGGYIEIRGGKQREIPKEMIIDIRDLNPFDERKPLAMVDAAVSPSFTLKTASDYTTKALKNNTNSPGIITTGVIMSPEKFRNFKERILNREKGEPLFGNGPGAIDYNEMTTDLSKSALKEINEQTVQELITVAGMSKTMMGIEQSGTTRETARVQKDELIESEVLPRVQFIIDALNQDYENNAPASGRVNAKIIVNNPLKIDHESDEKHSQVLTKRADLYTKLVSDGYDSIKAALFVKGEIEIDELGEPINKPEPVEQPSQDQPDDDISDNKAETHDHTHDLHLNDRISGQVQQQEGALKNAIINIEEQIVATAISRVEKVNNAFEESDQLVTETEKNELRSELVLALTGFYGLVMSLEGSRTMRSRTSKYALLGIYKMNSGVKKYIKETADKVSRSHVDTVVNDIWKTARDAAIKGQSRREIVNAIKQKYSDVITETRAKTIARTETNRAFTRAQYEADEQFVKQNKLQGRVFKQWRTRSDNPCEFCKSIERQGLIPFEQPFRNVGDTVKVDKKTLEVNFETVRAGNLHPNCSCDYELVIIGEQDNLSVSQKAKLEILLDKIEEQIHEK